MRRLKIGLLVTALLVCSWRTAAFAEELLIEEITDVADEAAVEEAEEIDYLLGRPMTEEERKIQEELVPELISVPLEDEEVGESFLVMRTRGVLPASYDSRDYGYISSVKNQNPYGICWAFTANALAETSYMMQNPGTEVDFSELHTAYYFYNRTTDALRLTTGDRNNTLNGNDYRSNGGNNMMVSFALSGWTGTESEKDAPYEWMSQSKPPLQTAQEFSADTKLKNAYFIKGGAEQIKQAIINQGAVGIMYYHDYSFYNADTGAYCYNGSVEGSTNHAVTLVGWDDSYSKDNFLASSGVETNGAWIAKNSWGTAFGDDGYFYISYEDPLVTNAVSMEFVSEDTYDNNYHYDGSSLTTAFVLKANQALANVYTACANQETGEVLTAVNFAVQSADVPYSIQIYRDLTNRMKPESGTAVLSEPITGTTTFAGIYTVDLPEFVYLEPGCTFAIVIEFPAGGNYYAETTRQSTWVSSTAVLADKQSFYRGTSGTWFDFNSISLNSRQCARVKGFTDSASEKLSGVKLLKCIQRTENEVYLEWEKASNADGYCIYRSDTPDGVYSMHNIIDDSETISIAFSERSGTRYWYKVAPWKKTANDIVIGMCGNEKMALAQPEMTAKCASYNSAKMTWQPVKGATGYRIYRSASKNGTYTAIRNLKDASVLSYTNGSLATDTTYYYKMRAFCVTDNATYYSEYTDPIAVKVKLTTPILKGSAAGYEAAKLTWKKVTGATGYRIYRSASEDGTYTAIRNLKDSTVLTYNNSGLTTNTTYYYKMRAFRVVGSKTYYSEYTKPIAIKPTLATPVLKGSSAGYKSAKLTWNKISGATGYRIYRSTSEDGTYTAIRNLKDVSVLSYTNSSLKTGTTYYYKMRAFRIVGSKTYYSEYTKPITVKPVPAKAVISSITAQSGKKIKISWNAVPGATGYRIYRSTTSSGRYAQVATLTSASVKSFVDKTSKTAGKRYYYKVRAYRTVGETRVYGTPSSAKSAVAK